MNKATIIFLISSLFISCSSIKWPLLDKKSFCVQECNYFVTDKFITNDKAFYDEKNIDYCSPFIFKADSILYLKDTIFNFYGNLKAQKLLLKTKFAYKEFHGFVGFYAGISKNKIAFPIYISDKIDSTMIEKIIADLLDKKKGNIIQVASKGSKRFFEVIDKNNWTIYILENHALFIPESLPDGEEKSMSGDIGNGKTFSIKGLYFYTNSGYFFKAEEMKSYYLNRKDITKLYK